MKKIEAILKPVKVEQVERALVEMGVRGITTTDVKGFGREPGHAGIFRGARYAVDSIPEVKMEIVLQDSQLEAATAILLEANGEQAIDDGDILIIPVETALATCGK